MDSGQIAAILDSIDGKVRAGRASLDEIARRRKLIAFDAHHGGDAKAKAELADLAERAGRIGAELEDLAAAREEADRRLDEAFAKERKARAIELARESVVAIGRTAEAARSLDAAADAFAEALVAYLAAVEDVRRIGVVTDFPGQNRIDVLISALQAAFPNQLIFPGLAGPGRRCVEIAREIRLSGTTERMLSEADEEG